MKAFRNEEKDQQRNHIHAYSNPAGGGIKQNKIQTQIPPGTEKHPWNLDHRGSNGSSMYPTIQEGQIVVSVKGADFTQGDVIAFYYNNKILVKRMIAGPGSWVDIDKKGNVTVDGQPLDEPYLTEKALGDCNIKLPYQVPDGRYFVMGDHRSTSIDSRNTSVGCVAEEQIVGKIVFRLWPLKSFGTVK